MYNYLYIYIYIHMFVHILVRVCDIGLVAARLGRAAEQGPSKHCGVVSREISSFLETHQIAALLCDRPDLQQKAHMVDVPTLHDTYSPSFLLLLHALKGMCCAC